MGEEQKEWSANAKGLTFDPSKGRIMLYRNTIEALGTLEYFRFLFNPDKRKFAIQVFQIQLNFGIDIGHYISVFLVLFYK